MHDMQRQIYKTKKRVKALMRTVELQNKLLLMMARKMGLSVEVEDLDARDWVSETAQLEPAILQDIKDGGNEVSKGSEVASL